MTAQRQPPRGVLRLLARAPIALYRLRLGWLLGGRFLLLEHRGRRTGKPRRNVLEVVLQDDEPERYFVASAWGERSDWLRNVEADPNVLVRVGRRRREATAARVGEGEAERVFATYASRHRLAFRALSGMLGSDDPAVLARTIPLVALSPRD